jgi:hypothetical protein
VRKFEGKPAYLIAITTAEDGAPYHLYYMLEEADRHTF